MPEQWTRICCKDQKWNWKITICSLNLFSFLSLLTTDPNSIQMTRSPPSELNILRRRDGRWRADRTWQRDQGIFHPSCESSYESRVYYNSCMRAGWRDHSDSRRHDRAKVQSLQVRAGKQQPQESQVRVPRTLWKPKEGWWMSWLC